MAPQPCARNFAGDVPVDSLELNKRGHIDVLVQTYVSLRGMVAG